MSLLANCIKGKRVAQKEFFLRYSPIIYTLCRRYAVDESQAKDYLQECFLQIFSNLKSYRGDGSSIEAWLYTVSRNTIFQILRKSKKNVKFSSLELVHVESMDSDIIDKLSEEEILIVIRNLPEIHRQIINLFVFEQLSHKEIADLLNITESTSRSQLSRARIELKKCLQNQKKTCYETKAI